MFHNVSKVVLCDRCNTLARFSKDELHCSWQAQHFGRVHRHFAWQAQHFRRVVLRVFADLMFRAASSGDNVQIPWQAWYFVRCDENWRTPRTKHRFSGSNFIKFWGSWENSKENIGFVATNLRKSCTIWGSNMSRHDSLIFLWRRRVYGGGSCKVAKVSKQVVMSFCVAGVECRESVESRLVWQAQGFQKMSCIFPWQAQHFRCVALRVFCESHCQGCVKWWQGANSLAGVGHWHRESVILGGAVFGEDPSCVECSFARQVQYLGLFTLCTSQLTLHTPHFRLHTLHFTLRTEQFTLHTLHLTLQTLHFTLHTLHLTPHTLHSTLYTPHAPPYTLHTTVHSTLYTPRSTLYTPHSYTLHSTLYTLHSTLYSWHSKL